VGGEVVGRVTSGTTSPTLGHPIAWRWWTRTPPQPTLLRSKCAARTTRRAVQKFLFTSP